MHAAKDLSLEKRVQLMNSAAGDHAVNETIEEREARRQNGGAAAWGLISLLFWVVVIAIWALLTGCVSGNTAEISAVRIEKQSTAQEVDQYVTSAGRVANWLFRKGD